jgi:hypothetical protein
MGRAVSERSGGCIAVKKYTYEELLGRIEAAYNGVPVLSRDDILTYKTIDGVEYWHNATTDITLTTTHTGGGGSRIPPFRLAVYGGKYSLLDIYLNGLAPRYTAWELLFGLPFALTDRERKRIYHSVMEDVYKLNLLAGVVPLTYLENPSLGWWKRPYYCGVDDNKALLYWTEIERYYEDTYVGIKTRSEWAYIKLFKINHKKKLNLHGKLHKIMGTAFFIYPMDSLITDHVASKIR